MITDMALDRGRADADVDSGLEAGLQALEAGVAAALAVTRGLQRRLGPREESAYAQLTEKADAVAERSRVARKRLAPFAAELCELEAQRCAEVSELEVMRRALRTRQAKPWSCDSRHIGSHIRLCVGGAEFDANVHDLREGSAWFAALLSDEFPISYNEADGIFIDRDGMHFALILDYLQLGLSSVQARLAELGTRERRELLEEADFYRIPALVAAAVVPGKGCAVVTLLASHDLARKGIVEPFHHTVCNRWHAPGTCSAQPVGCAIMGTAAVTCIVHGYWHRPPASGASTCRFSAPDSEIAFVTGAVSMGDQDPEVPEENHTGTVVGDLASSPVGAPLWILEYGDHLFKATEDQFMRSAEMDSAFDKGKIPFNEA